MSQVGVRSVTDNHNNYDDAGLLVGQSTVEAILADSEVKRELAEDEQCPMYQTDVSVLSLDRSGEVGSHPMIQPEQFTFGEVAATASAHDNDSAGLPAAPYPELNWTNLKLVITSGSPSTVTAAVNISRDLLTRLARSLQDVADQKQAEGASYWARFVRELFLDNSRNWCHTAPCPEADAFVTYNGYGWSQAIDAQVIKIELVLHNITMHGHKLENECAEHERRHEVLLQQYNEVQGKLLRAKTELDAVAAKCWDFMRGVSDAASKEQAKLQQKHEAREAKSEALQHEDDSAQLGAHLWRHLDRYDILSQEIAALHAALQSCADRVTLLKQQRDDTIPRKAATRKQMATAVSLQRGRKRLLGVLLVLISVSAWATTLAADGRTTEECPVKSALLDLLRTADEAWLPLRWWPHVTLGHC
ncbi:hypothetical protein SPBR_07273 [Sporothrix brasiliensis 5110]|uniref:Uncharacterized protein n=1 Tax=Sporothrix brasiliensis 5110 TaxID=1398154 RepID=A0A0C2IMT8_9PEZI|nr:uncharacterized protein SPBR_07273 [Sporothrix brasiliensis 5110]KIH88335.1 hypothetical protein SPBR_07273 [Sporothrix brasiliensis 5110]